MRARVVAMMQLLDGFVVKSRQFGPTTYIGDPINTVKIFNDKGIDELVVVDISERRGQETVSADQIERIATEAFMPVAYGGGIKTVQQVRDILSAGVEKVAFGSGLLDCQDVVAEAASLYGRQAVVGAIDVSKDSGVHRVYPGGGGRPLDLSPADWAEHVCGVGVGEILLTSMERESEFSGYDLRLIESVVQRVNVPVIANGGAGRLEHFTEAVNAGAAAVAAGSMFTFYGPHRAVLITYPTESELDAALSRVED